MTMEDYRRLQALAAVDPRRGMDLSVETLAWLVSMARIVEALVQVSLGHDDFLRLEK